MPETTTTTRAYTLKLSGNDDWRKSLWTTHVTVNRGVQVWGDWLLSLRGGLPASLADADPKRRVLLALSWLSVESPASLVDENWIVPGATGLEKPETRAAAIRSRLTAILKRRGITDPQPWLDACLPALTACIRDDAVWVDRDAAFLDLVKQTKNRLTIPWATSTLFELLGGEAEFFKMEDEESDEPKAPAEAKDFVQKAGGWLSRNWGSGKKSDAQGIADLLTTMSEVSPKKLVGKNGPGALRTLVQAMGGEPAGSSAEDLYSSLKRTVGWKGRSSKGAMALEKIRDASLVDEATWTLVRGKLQEEAAAQAGKSDTKAAAPEWMPLVRSTLENRIGMPFRTQRDLTWEHAVILDHALRRVSSAHSWIKLAEAERRKFQKEAELDRGLSAEAKRWLDHYRDERSESSGAGEQYLIHKRAIDGWEKIVSAWAGLANATPELRVQAARDVQSNLDDNEKFGDIQLFEHLAVDDAQCVWMPSGKPDAAILKNYVTATSAAFNQRRFKVPAYRHPDPLRHPVYVDFGNSRWSIGYSALEEVQNRKKLSAKLPSAETEAVRKKIQSDLDRPPHLHGVTLSLWTGDVVEPNELRWHSNRLRRDFDFNHFGEEVKGTVSRADRLGRAAGRTTDPAVAIASVFDQKDWNGRLQIRRNQLERLADVLYGRDPATRKRNPPTYAALDDFLKGQSASGAKAKKLWDRLDWFLSFSAKLQPAGPWLDRVAEGLPDGVQYKQGKTGWFVSYDANKERKGRARLMLSRIPGLRVLSFDLGHRYAAACAVWETISTESLLAACQRHKHALPGPDDQYVHLKIETAKRQKSGRRKGEPVTQTIIYRRIGPDRLPDGTIHLAPWARLDRQFLVKLQGEDREVRFAAKTEFDQVNELREFLGLTKDPIPPLRTIPGSVNIRVDELMKEAARLARLGLRRHGDAARIAHALTATSKPIAGGRSIPLDGPKNRPVRIEFILDALMLWQSLAKSSDYTDVWALNLWNQRINSQGSCPLLEIPASATRPERRKRTDAAREKLQSVAEVLADRNNADLHQLWADKWRERDARWQKGTLRWLRDWVFLRKKPSQSGDGKSVRQVGGLSTARLKTMRDVYQVLKAFHMRPVPEDLRRNVPEYGSDQLANFGQRMLNRLEERREQRIKQLASRIVEAALGVGSDAGKHRQGHARPQQPIGDARFQPCHVVVAENLERYRPEESRFRRENRQLMDWAARNVRKFIKEGCELHGLHFVEVSPNYTSRQDSRTGAPGVRCEDFPFNQFVAAIAPAMPTPQGLDRKTAYLRQRIQRAQDKVVDPDSRPAEQLLVVLQQVFQSRKEGRTPVRIIRPGGEIFVSSDPDSPAARGLQADLNAAANIGLKPLLDPDWLGAWWFVLVDMKTGKPVEDKVKGAEPWKEPVPLLPPQKSEDDQSAGGKARKGMPAISTDKLTANAWKTKASGGASADTWHTTATYWRNVEEAVANILRRTASESDDSLPF